MRHLSRTLGMFVLSLAAACSASVEDSAYDPTSEAESSPQALGSDCKIDPDGSAYCAQTAVATVLGREVYYRLGVNSGPGYDAATGRHAAVVLFQGTSPQENPLNLSGGQNGPGATWSKSLPKPGSFAVWHQIATVIALIDAGYTVIQPAARFQCTAGCGYYWDSNIPFTWTNAAGTDKPLVGELIARLQPSATTFGAIDIHHVYAMGISSGGYMSSRMANEFAGGVNNDSTVKSTTLPFRAVAIQSAAFQTCGPQCRPFAITPVKASHAPTFFLHDPKDEIVPFSGMMNYFDKLNALFQGGNAAYTVNGVRQTFLLMDPFDGTAGLPLGHQWSQELSADSGNLILEWFNSHR